MATIEHEGEKFTVYYDTIRELKFIMNEKEADRFTALVRKHKQVENIDPKELLTGVYLSQKTNTVVGLEADDIVANSVKFYTGKL